MKNIKLLLCASVAAALASTTAMAQEEPLDDRWYGGVSAGLVWGDNDRLVENQDYHYGINFGRFFSPDFSLDLRLDRYSLEFDPSESGRGDLSTQESYGVLGRYHFRRGESTRPYVLAGLGIQQHKNAFDSGRDIYASLGLGIAQQYSDNFSMRLEAEYRHDNDRDTVDSANGFDDFLLTVGFNYAFGERPRAAAPAPAPTPTPARAPRVMADPTPEPEPMPEPEVIFEFSSEVAFGLNSADLQPAAVAELNEAIELLSRHSELSRIRVAGYTCDLGAADYNQRLSEQRAQAVHDYLVANGIDGDRLSVRGYGEDRPKVPNNSDSNRRMNRRVELMVIERTDG